MSVTQVYQGIVGGGKDEAWKYGGRGDLTFNLDTHKLGLWPGGHFTVEVEGNFSDSVNGLTGALNPVNTNQLFPMPIGDNLNVPNVSFMQILSPYAAMQLGKLALLTPTSGDMNEFAHGKGDTQFMNGAFNINPVTLFDSAILGSGRRVDYSNRRKTTMTPALVFLFFKPTARPTPAASTICPRTN